MMLNWSIRHLLIVINTFVVDLNIISFYLVILNFIYTFFCASAEKNNST